jgi:CHAD domain-containing protein
MMEIEAKFAVPDQSILDRLGAADELAGYELGEGEVVEQADTYLDTAADSIAGGGYYCRRRTTSRGIVMTLKSLADSPEETTVHSASGDEHTGSDDGARGQVPDNAEALLIAGAIHRRSEVEVEIASGASGREGADGSSVGDTPTGQTVADWPAGPARDLVLSLTGDAPLEPLFELRQTRRLRPLRRGHQLIAELSLDRVTVLTAAGAKHFSEVEVELRPDGGEQDLAAVAAVLRNEWHLQPQPLAKYARALALIGRRRGAVTLTPADARHCATLAQRDDGYGRRALALLAVHHGKSQRQAAAESGISERRVRFWTTKYRRVGMAVFPARLRTDEVGSAERRRAAHHGRSTADGGVARQSQVSATGEAAPQGPRAPSGNAAPLGPRPAATGDAAPGKRLAANDDASRPTGSVKAGRPAKAAGSTKATGSAKAAGSAKAGGAVRAAITAALVAATSKQASALRTAAPSATTATATATATTPGTTPGTATTPTSAAPSASTAAPSAVAPPATSAAATPAASSTADPIAPLAGGPAVAPPWAATGAADEYELTADDTMASAAVQVLAEHFARMLDHEDGTRADEDPEHLHDMRVATRRQRAALRVFAANLDPEVMRPYKKALRHTGRALGAVRDLDVFLIKTQRYLETLPAERSDDLEPLLAAWRAERAHARRRLLTHLDSQGFARFKSRFATALAAPHRLTVALPGERSEPVPQRLQHVLPAVLFERAATVWAFADVLGSEHVPLWRYHQLRKASKGLRYTLEFFADVLGPDARPLIKDVKRLQDHLGDLQDAVVCSDVIRTFLLWGTWQRPDDLRETVDEMIVAPGVAAYLAARQAEMIELVRTFPPVWAAVSGGDFRRRLAELVASLEER